MKYDITLERIANCYYNLGLERARLRDLSGAAELLKKSLLFDKYQKDARNLLGLIFFECGETADALVQWVISMNLNPEENDADHYLDEIQRKPGILRVCSDNVKRYNQALDYAQHNNDDLAVMQLNQVIVDKPNYIKAHILLALLYMKNERWVKAGKSLFKVLRIDRNNPRALVLMDVVKRKTGRKEVEQNRLKNVFSHRRMADDDVLVPQEVKQISPWAVVMYILFGVVLALFCFEFLLMPARTKALNSKNNSELIYFAEKLDVSNMEYAALSEEHNELSSRYDAALEKLSQYENENASFIKQYQTLNRINVAYESGDLASATMLYKEIDESTITDENMREFYNQIKSYMEGSVYQMLADQGTAAWNAGNIGDAENLYKLSLLIREEPENMYLLARLYQARNDMAMANELFDRVVGEHPESPYAQRAREARGY